MPQERAIHGREGFEGAGQAVTLRLVPANGVPVLGIHIGALQRIAPGDLDVFMSHGSPPDDLRHIEDLDRIQDLGAPGDPYLTKVLVGFLTHYGQRDDVSARFLAAASAGGVPARVVVHGHDRDERGFFYEGQRQLCLCIFGAPRQEKRYLRLDLAGHYQQATDLRDGIEILRLHT